MLPPGGKNWQLIFPHWILFFVSLVVISTSVYQQLYSPFFRKHIGSHEIQQSPEPGSQAMPRQNALLTKAAARKHGQGGQR